MNCKEYNTKITLIAMISLILLLLLSNAQQCVDDSKGKFESTVTNPIDSITALLSDSTIRTLLKSPAFQEATLGIFEGAMGFVRRVGILPREVSGYCFTLAQDFYNTTVISLQQLFKSENILMASINLVQSVIEVKVMYQKCVDEVSYMKKKISEYSELNYMKISERLFNRSGIIAYNLFNSIYGISAKDYYRAGAWIGSGIYNVINYDILDDPIFGNNY